MIDIPRIIEGCKHCLNTLGYSYMCYGCPYASEDECTKILSEDTITALKRLEFLEKPTPEEQPELPGIKDHFIDEQKMDQDIKNWVKAQHESSQKTLQDFLDINNAYDEWKKVHPNGTVTDFIYHRKVCKYGYGMD